MRHRILAWSIFTTLLASLSACNSSSGGSSAPPINATVFAVRGDNELIRFHPDVPDMVEVIATITPLDGGEQIIDIDFRSAEGDQALYALTNAGRLLIVDPESGEATEVAGFVPPFAVDPELVAAMDFKPTGQVTLRLLDRAGESRRVAPPFDEEGLTDGALGYLADALVAAAYSHPAPGSDQTALFAIDIEAARLMRIGGLPAGGGDCDEDRPYPEDNPNCGAVFEIGPLGVDVTAVGGYDIVQLGLINEHYAVLEVEESHAIYALDAGNGAATAVSDALDIDDIIGLVAQYEDGGPLGLLFDSLPAVLGSGERLISLLHSSGDQPVLVAGVLDLDAGSFNADASANIDGIGSGEALVGIDLRSADEDLDGNDTLYALSDAGVLYQLLAGDTAGVIEAVEVSKLVEADDPDQAISLGGNRFAIDFNPRANRLRIISDTGQNLRVNVDDGTTAVDKPLRMLSDPRPLPLATAYENAFVGAEETMQFIIDGRDHSLAAVALPNDGVVVSIGPLFAFGAPAEGAPMAFNIAGPNNELALIALVIEGDTRSTLARINLENGSPNPVGLIGAEGDPAVTALTIRLNQD
jgi:hypothetical protein